MGRTVARLLRVPLTVGAVWALLALATPLAMARYAPFVTRLGVSCERPFVIGRATSFAPGCRDLAEIYHLSFTQLFVDSTLRSLSLLIGAGLLALGLGTLLGVTAALLRKRAWASGGVLAVTALLIAVPAFFVAYFLQILVIIVGSSAEGARLLPVQGFGYDGHLVLPLVSISLAAIAFTGQLTATRMQDVLDSDFMTAATAKGLSQRWILRVHVLPHVRPVLLEAFGSGLRVSVASLPIVEYLFDWRGIGQLALEAVGVHDAAGFVFSTVVLAALFSTMSAIADVSRPRGLYSAA